MQSKVDTLQFCCCHRVLQENFAALLQEIYIFSEHNVSITHKVDRYQKFYFAEIYMYTKSLKIFMLTFFSI